MFFVENTNFIVGCEWVIDAESSLNGIHFGDVIANSKTG
ncbi:hypothetical protein FLJC2902T_06530 [Flavobacterium limnosediminis JC2902]|uniref:Uncharacterized protein n=1 Tax=Flavobacterium limnosediminis JC2902 TaxID=1341181 RepID=V6SSW5_9FLAO|nr:hypothetical protein FLJC2902T_06530 [Flavobacterium limnosediminis JC2902]